MIKQMNRRDYDKIKDKQREGADKDEGEGKKHRGLAGGEQVCVDIPREHLTTTEFSEGRRDGIGQMQRRGREGQSLAH